MILKELQINNFLSHDKTKIAFKENEKILIDGKSGSGKSSITEAILWCLFGRGRSDNRTLVRRGTKMASVCLKLSEGELETVITRSVSNTGKNTLAATQNTGSKGQFIAIERTGLKDIQEWIEKIFLKASYELFTNSVAYPQENESSFVKATATKRKDLLLEIVGAGNFDQLYDKTRDALSANNLEKAEILAKVQTLEEGIRNAQELEKKYEFYKKESDGLLVSIDTSLILEKGIESKINSFKTLSNQLEEKKKSKDMLVSSWKYVVSQLETDQKSLDEYANFDIETARKNVKEIEDLTEQENVLGKELGDIYLSQQKINEHLSKKPVLNDYTKEIELINKRLIPLIQSSGSCPAGDDCPFVIPIKGQIDFLSEQIAEKEKLSKSEKIARELWEQDYVLMTPPKDIDSINTQIKDIKDKISCLLPWKDRVIRYEMFEETKKKIEEFKIKGNEEKAKLMNEIAQVDSQIRQIGLEIESIDINQINKELAELRLNIQQLQKQKDEATSGLAIAKQAGDIVVKSAKEVMDLKIKERELYSASESLELLKEALSPKGIKAVVVDWLIPQIEERINEILGQLSDFRIRLDTQKAKANEDDGTKEGLWITVINGQGEEMSYENFSGGEKVKITISISEALCSLQNSVGFRIMDENIISLDKESTESFVEVLTKLQEKFPQLLIISHLEEVKSIFEKQIMITKVNGVSKLSPLST